MAKSIFMFLLLLINFSFSQVPSSDSSFVDKIRLIIEPEYQFLFDQLDNKVLDGKPYIGKAVDGKLKFNMGHILGLKVGLKGFGLEFFYSIRTNYLKNSPDAFFKLKNGKVIGKIIQNQYLAQDLYLQYYFKKFMGLGLNYKIIGEKYSPKHEANYPSLLNIDLFYSILYLYVPYKFKTNYFSYTGKIG
ncbi:MAG: hypothetical protein GXO77_07665, partial [Calditrichaeota bacterium]|nr:hypothetical protein [Calditrichota bacterium]